MNDLGVWIASGFMLGLLSSGHCLAMCGPVSLYLGVKMTSESQQTRKWTQQIQVYVGKSLTYGLIGLLCGYLGIFFHYWFKDAGWARELPKFFGVVMILLGLLLTFRVTAIEGQIKKAETHLLCLIKSVFSFKSQAGFLLVGMLWGLLPCPMVLAPAIGSAVSGSSEGIYGAVRGFFMMSAFGVGTTPVLCSTGWISSWALGRVSRFGKPMIGSFLILTGLTFVFFAEKMHTKMLCHH